MKIDIAINFNDLVPPPGIGMGATSAKALRIVMLTRPSYYNQLICLIKSIKVNWRKSDYDYSIYVHHSRDLRQEKKKILEAMGCEVIFNPSEIQPYMNRENVYIHETDGSHTLILDTDMMVLNTPRLDFEKEMYVKPSPNQHSVWYRRKRREKKVPPALTRKQWGLACKRLNVEYNPKAINNFNGGCVFINNDSKRKWYDLWVLPENLEVLKLLESYNRHFASQVYFSILLKKMNWGCLNNRINVFANRTPLHRASIDILHYLGNSYKPKIKTIARRIHQRYARLMRGI